MDLIRLLENLSEFVDMVNVKEYKEKYFPNICNLQSD
jgi:hypothetical protein